ncbi:MAG: selenocysteine-specific translation elongation factor [Candidatus Xenobium sp.]|jgi:selenocysteine-specific elongation factor|nr:selenocysteine-specific translation elongation factor [Burkholderiales bacterium]
MSTKHFILGTAGHVDHGKTTLLKALTGIDTDRLPEEKARGLSIDLGFANLELPGRIRAGIVDVPGHERFLKNMLAGVGGLDLAMLVVDTREGARPQTHEHLDILDLLATRAGVVVLTKMDLVEPDLADLAEEALRRELAGTFLAQAPIVRVSGLTGEGLDRLRETLAEALEGLPVRPTEAPFHLPVDRVFLRAGFGAVVTGTLWAGRLQLADRVEILPERLEARVRGLQVHGESVSEVCAGQRMAVNLARVEPGSLHRGQVLAPPGLLVPTRRLDLRLRTLPRAARPLRHRDQVRLYAGTAEALGRVFMMEGDDLAPGSQGLVQVALEEPVVLRRLDRVILRDFTAQHTVGGGEVLDPAAPRHRRGDVRVLAELRRHQGSDAAQPLLAVLARASGGARTPGALAQDLQLPLLEVQSLVEELVASGEVVRLGRYVALTHQVLPLRQQLAELLGNLVQAAPWKGGWRREEILRLLGAAKPRLAEEVLSEACRCGEVVDRCGLLAPRAHVPRLDPAQQEALQRVEEVLLKDRFTPVDWDDVPYLAEVDARLWKVLEDHLLETGRAVRLTPQIVFLESLLEEARGILAERIRAEGPLTASRAREALQTTRKYAIPLLEHFDQTRFTRRVGDLRDLAWNPESGKDPSP